MFLLLHIYQTRCRQGCSSNTSVTRWLGDWLFSSKSSKPHNSQTVTARELKFWDNVHPIPCVMCHMSHGQQLNKTGNRWHMIHGVGWTVYQNKVKVRRADLLDFDFNFEDIFRLGNISVFGNILNLLTYQFWLHLSFSSISVMVTF